MESFRVLMFVAAAVLLCSIVASAVPFGTGGCPTKHMVTNSKPECNSDADCYLYGKICCPNQHNKKSCTDRAVNGRGNDKSKVGVGGSGHKNIGAGVYCNGVKCQPWQKCLPDRYTKQLKCQ